MATKENVPIGRVKICTINGKDVRLYLRKLSLRESICTSHLTGELYLYDCSNFIDNQQFTAGDQIIFEFDAPPESTVYDAIVYILTIQAEVSPDSLKCINYTISFVGGEFYRDRQVVGSWYSSPNQPGTALIQKVWTDSAMPSKLTIDMQDGPLQTGNNPLTFNQLSPYTAIAQIRDQMNPRYPTGNVLIYRDKTGEVLAQLQDLFNNLSSQQTFIQKATWGISWRDMFEADNMILDAKQQTRGSGTPSAGGMDLAASIMQGIRKFDNFMGKMVNNQLKAMPSGVAGVVSMMGSLPGTSMFGGQTNIVSINTDNRQAQQDFTPKIMDERTYAAYIKSMPQFNIRVPLRTGIKCTVGKGAKFQLLPIDDGTATGKANSMDAIMLISDLIHEVYTDLRFVRGTTTFQLLRGKMG